MYILITSKALLREIVLLSRPKPFSGGIAFPNARESRRRHCRSDDRWHDGQSWGSPSSFVHGIQTVESSRTQFAPKDLPGLADQTTIFPMVKSPDLGNAWDFTGVFYFFLVPSRRFLKQIQGFCLQKRPQTPCRPTSTLLSRHGESGALGVIRLCWWATADSRSYPDAPNESWSLKS